MQSEWINILVVVFFLFCLFNKVVTDYFIYLFFTFFLSIIIIFGNKNDITIKWIYNYKLHKYLCLKNNSLKIVNIIMKMLLYNSIDLILSKKKKKKITKINTFYFLLHFLLYFIKYNYSNFYKIVMIVTVFFDFANLFYLYIISSI
jgi:hypothetical protein